MNTDLLNALSSCLKESVVMRKTRLDTFCVLVVGVLVTRTVNLTHIAGLFPTKAEISSNYRRLQRFFKEVTFDYDAIALFIVRLTGLGQAPWMLALDRTNWKLGKTNINILMLAVSGKGIGIPLMWMELGKAGNSRTKERTALVTRFCKLFGADRIAGLTGDREFVGNDWMNFLIERNIPFILRLREDFIITIEGRSYTLWSLLRKLKKGSGRTIFYDVILGAKSGSGSPRVHLACKRLANGELLILATNCNPETASANYRMRWQIETLFAACKSRGFNLEDTHLIHSERIEKLLAVLAVAFGWAHATGEWRERSRPIKIKTHQRKAQSVFRYGLDLLRKLLATDTLKAIRIWHSFLKNPPSVISLSGQPI
jgi:hypothetical protein